MPLRDHFRPPVDDVSMWEELHGLWPGLVVMSLYKQLPSGYSSAPRLQIAKEYEVRIYDRTQGKRLVAALEFVCPADKNPGGRRVFAMKCATLLQNDVSVTIIDVVTTRTANLYDELLGLMDQSDPALSGDSPNIYAVTCRATKVSGARRFEAWLHFLQVGEPLPTLPLWLSADLAIPIDLEAAYEETCKTLLIP